MLSLVPDPELFPVSAGVIWDNRTENRKTREPDSRTEAPEAAPCPLTHLHTGSPG